MNTIDAINSLMSHFEYKEKVKNKDCQKAWIWVGYDGFDKNLKGFEKTVKADTFREALEIVFEENFPEAYNVQDDGTIIADDGIVVAKPGEEVFYYRLGYFEACEL